MGVTFQSIVEQFAMPHLKDVVQRMIAEKQNLIVDGISVLEPNEHNWMIAGTTVNAMSCLYAGQLENELTSLRDMIRFTSNYPMRTWGIAFYLEGLYRLQSNQVLDHVLEPDVLERLQRELDWHHFVDTHPPSLLPNYPSNYYGVAYMIARFRELLGWGNTDCDSALF